IALVCLLTAVPARAEKADREKPINYSADTGDVNYLTKVGSLAGNVIITQGTLTIRADRMVFRQNPDNSMMVTAFGNPVSFRQERSDPRQATRTRRPPCRHLTRSSSLPASSLRHPRNDTGRRR